MTTPVAQFSGLASGIDTSGIIAQLQKVAQAPINNLQNTASGYGDKLTSWQDFNSRLASLQSATNALTQKGTFTAVSGVSTNTSVASFTASAGATLGEHSLTIQQLAQAQKVVSQSQSSSTTALGLSGTFTLNGKSITARASDTLADIGGKINAAGAGVSASVVAVGASDFRLTLTGTTTGAASAFAAADNSGGDAVLSRLGLLSGSPAIRQTIAPGAGQTGAASLTLGSATQTIASGLGLPATPTGSFTINGASVDSVDLNTDTLTSIANKINGAQIAGISAKVVSLPDATGNASAGSRQQLQIISSNTDGSGNAVPPAFSDASGVLSTLGVTQQNFTTVLAAPQDAKFTLDGLNLTRASNIVTDAIPSGTLKLLSGTPASPGTTTLSVAQNTDSTVQSVANFVNAYNGIQDFVTLQNQFTPATAANGTTAATNPLFGDTTLSSVQDALTQALSAVSGKTTLQDIGVTSSGTGKLTLNASVLTTALQNDPNKVASLFGQTGQADNGGVTFLNATTKTQATAGTGYSVQISQAATQASGRASIAQTTANASSPAETLTFGGTQFSSPVSLTLVQGSSLQDTVNQINSSGALNGKIYASIDSSTHALTLSAQQYGAGNGFTVQSNTAASSSNSGIGTGTTITDGTDVAGTINGEAATGKGRTLTGAGGNAKTDGLALLVSATPADITGASTYDGTTHTASFGHVSFTHGVADALKTTLTQVLDPVNGAVIGAENSLNLQITDAQKQIQALQDRVTSYTNYLRQMFSDMEKRVSALQAQGSAFAAQTGTTSTTGKK